jgi:hypothetical protein
MAVERTRRIDSVIHLPITHHRLHSRFNNASESAGEAAAAEFALSIVKRSQRLLLQEIDLVIKRIQGPFEQRLSMHIIFHAQHAAGASKHSRSGSSIPANAPPTLSDALAEQRFTRPAVRDRRRDRRRSAAS